MPFLKKQFMSGITLRSEFGRNVLTLMMGTGLAQAIGVALSPILTRLYGPEEFGIFALFMAITGVVCIPSSGRYELAVLLPENDGDAANLVVSALAMVFVSSICILALVLAGKHWIAGWLGHPEIEQWLYGVPVMVLMTGVYQTLNYWFNRKKRYDRLAVNRTIRAGLITGGSVAFGYPHFVSGGMIIGTIIGQGLTSLMFLGQAGKEDWMLRRDVSWARMRSLMIRYKKFPLFSIPADMVNAVSSQMPVFIMSIFFGPAVVGFFSLTQRVLWAPTSVVAAAFSDVFKQQASRDINAMQNCRRLWLKTAAQLATIVILPGIVLALWGPQLFGLVFGERWAEAGKYARVMVPMFCLSLVASPLSGTLYVAEKQHADLLWQIGLLVSTGLGLYVGCRMHSPVWCIGLYAAAYALMYIVYLWMSFIYSGGTRGASDRAGLGKKS